jgi:hypothetical protein
MWTAARNSKMTETVEMFFLKSGAGITPGGQRDEEVLETLCVHIDNIIERISETTAIN